MFGLGPIELGIILLIALMVFGAGKLPQVGGALGKSIREFREATDSVEAAANPKPAAAVTSEPAKVTVEAAYTSPSNSPSASA